ncbi:hypothetical protein [Demequina litorisediminis]|uniref:hypothetical protein n=1 Tax=Demequina litorisediminis TaxID=1849022 RepID=UPI003D66D9E8
MQAQLTGEEGVEETLPTLYLPVNETVHFYLDSRDVIHSFWIPAFLYKEDTVPGRTNEWQVTPTQTGTYQGKCAEPVRRVPRLDALQREGRRARRVRRAHAGTARQGLRRRTRPRVQPRPGGGVHHRARGD